MKSKRPIVLNGYKFAFRWHSNFEEGRFKLDGRGSWLSCLLLGVGLGWKIKSSFWWVKWSDVRWTGEAKPGSKLEIMRKAVCHLNAIKLWHFLFVPLLDDYMHLTLLCSHFLCPNPSWYSQIMQVAVITPSRVLTFFVLTTHMFAAFHWKEARLIACTSLLARNTRGMKCEASVGVRGCVIWCVWANVVLPVPDIPATL